MRKLSYALGMVAMTTGNQDRASRRLYVWAAAATALCALYAPTAGADEAMLGEIIVTAQKKAERLQSVPVTVSAFDKSFLDAAGVVSVDTLSRMTPNVYMSSFAPSKPQIYIRGVGSRQFDIGSEPSVGVFIDEVYVGRTHNIFNHMLDVERVEVLKGPQGTLYGRNTIGGAINIITAEPTQHLEAFAKAGGGNYDAYFAEAAVSGAVAPEKVSARLAARYTKRDGYLKNLATGGAALGEDQIVVRGKLKFDAAEQFSLTLSGEYNHDDAPGQQGKAEGPDIFLRSPVAPIVAPTPDRFSDYYNEDSTLERNLAQLSGKARWQNDNVSIVSVTGYRYSKLEEFGDIDATILDIIDQDISETSKQFTQELRIASENGGAYTFEDRMSWIIGGYYLHDSSDRSDTFILGPDSLPAFLYLLAGGTDTILNTLLLDSKTESYAFFGQVSVALTPALNFTAGLRYSHDKKHGIYSGLTNIPGTLLIFFPFEFDLRRTWSSVDPKFTLDYHFSDDAMAFITYSTGYKGGGFQWAVTDPLLAQRVFDPEEVRYYEAGLKTQWLNRRLTVNIAAFYNDYKDLQVQRIVATSTGGASGVITNAANSTIKGFELEVLARPLPELLLSFGYGYLDAQYDDYVFDEFIDYSDTRMVRSPKHTLNAAVDYTIPVRDSDEISVRADWSYSSSYFHEPGEAMIPAPQPQAREDGYHLVNLRASYASGAWRLTGYVNNVFDKAYRQALLAYPPIGDNPGQNIGYPARPRMYGLEIGWSLN